MIRKMQPFVDDIRSHFDSRASTYAGRSPWVNDVTALEPIAQVIANSDGEVLEIGVGTGAVPDFLEATGRFPRRYVGLDVSPAMLRHARTWTPVLGSALELPFASRTFGVVVARQMLHYVDPAIALAEAKRVLRNGGALIVAQIGPFDLAEDVAWWRAAVALRQPLRQNALSADELRALVVTGGFSLRDELEVNGRSSLKNWVSRYEIDAGARMKLVEHFASAPIAVAHARGFEQHPDGDIEFATRWKFFVGEPIQ